MPEEEVERMEMQERIQYEIGRLPDKYRSVIILRYIEELPLQEIGDILELPLGTVKTRVHRGREALRKQMGNIVGGNKYEYVSGTNCSLYARVFRRRY